MYRNMDVCIKAMLRSLPCKLMSVISASPLTLSLCPDRARSGWAWMETAVVSVVPWAAWSAVPSTRSVFLLRSHPGHHLIFGSGGHWACYDDDKHIRRKEKAQWRGWYTLVVVLVPVFEVDVWISLFREHTHTHICTHARRCTHARTHTHTHTHLHMS